MYGLADERTPCKIQKKKCNLLREPCEPMELELSQNEIFQAGQWNMQMFWPPDPEADTTNFAQIRADTRASQ